jgi:hypothetical protein
MQRCFYRHSSMAPAQDMPLLKYQANKQLGADDSIMSRQLPHHYDAFMPRTCSIATETDLSPTLFSYTEPNLPIP